MKNWSVQIRYAPWLEKGPYLNDKAHDWGPLRKVREYLKESDRGELFWCLHREGEDSPFSVIPFIEDPQNKRYVLSFDRKGNFNYLSFFQIVKLNPDLADYWLLQLLSQFPRIEGNGSCIRIDPFPRSIDIGIWLFHFIQRARGCQLKSGANLSVVKPEGVLRVLDAIAKAISSVLQKAITFVLAAFWNHKETGFVSLQKFGIFVPVVRVIRLEKCISQLFSHLIAPFGLGNLFGT